MTLKIRDATAGDVDLIAWTQVEASRSNTPLGFWDLGRAAGFSKAHITHLIDNAPAKRAYERAGFAHVDEKRDPQFEAIFGRPGTARMWIDL